MGLHFLAFWPCGPSCPCILAFWAFIYLDFGIVGLHFLAFWHFGPLFPCILAFWAFFPLHFGLLGVSCWGPSHKLQKTARFLNEYTKNLAAPGPAPFCNFSPSGPSFPCILALSALISLRFGLVGLHFLAFWPFGPSFPCILALWAFISLHFGLVGLHFLAFWPCRLSFPCILALWAFISLHFGLLGLHFLAFWLCGPSFPCILAFLGFYFFAFWPFGHSFPYNSAFWRSASGPPLAFWLFGAHRLFCSCGSDSNHPRSYPWRSSRLFLILPSANRPRSYPWRPLTVLLALLGPRHGYFGVCWLPPGYYIGPRGAHGHFCSCGSNLNHPRSYPWRPSTFLLVWLQFEPSSIEPMALIKGFAHVAIIKPSSVIPLAVIGIFARVALLRTVLDHTHGAHRGFCSCGHLQIVLDHTHGARRHLCSCLLGLGMATLRFAGLARILHWPPPGDDMGPRPGITSRL